MIELSIDEHQLCHALADIEKAKARGFTHCLAVVQLKQVGNSVDDCRLEYSDLILKAHPTDETQNWGRGGFIEDYRCINRQCVEVTDEKWNGELNV